MATQIGELQFGKESAGRHLYFVSSYRLVETERGRFVEGSSPDGRQEFMCCRCGIDLHNVFVFTDNTKQSFMHVGIDCAKKMGIPLAELSKANAFWKNYQSPEQRAAAAAEKRAADNAREAKQRANLEANAALVLELEALKSDPNLTSYERNVIESALEACAWHSGWYTQDWLVDSYHGWRNDRQNVHTSLSARLDSVRERLALCKTSRRVEGTGKDKRTYKGTLRAYRPHFEIESVYGNTTISYLTDDCGNAFFVKSAEFYVRHGCSITGTFSIDDVDVRDGLIATRLMRPRKLDENCNHNCNWSFAPVDPKNNVG